ncbi:MAG TPA: hydantoinase B/oxoprolinase family protein [Candidatus Sulfotelmatobacter sp.]|nr:hydantoinase B/oxoprolinase family protein [Candidatus Sulfotelmatobacter sp.]
MTALNAITLEVLWTRLISIVDEAAAALVRTSFSTVVRESNDFACVLTDAAGGSLAQATDSIPSFIGTVPRTITHFLKEYPAEALTPGDILITNDIWLGTGHLPDITVAKPIFHRGRLVGFAGSVAHAPDIGGRIRSPDSRDVYEEGLQIPIMKAVNAGTIDATLERLLRKNVRVPDQVMGDLYAQFTALGLMEERVMALLAEHRLDSLAPLAVEIHARSEAAMRAAIRAVPNGVYRQSALMDGIAEPIPLEMTMTVSDDAIAIDYAGSAPQVQKAINVCMAYTIAYTAFGVKAVLAPDIPNNEGVLRPITITAPAGSIVNSTPPAAGGARALVGHFFPMMVIQALAKAMPDKVIATVGSPLWCVNLTGQRRDGSTFAGMFFANGGYGASATRDGAHVLSWPSNVSSTPVEMIEQLLPLSVRHRRIRAGSGGNGRRRGGNGQELLLESRAPGPITLAFLAERTREAAAPAGIAGGGAGAPGELLIDGRKVDPKTQHVVAPGGTVLVRTPGGGGYGPASERDPALIEADRADGYA